MPFTTRPSRTSRQGMMRLASMGLESPLPLGEKGAIGQRPCSRGGARALGSGGASGVIVCAMRLCPHCATQNPPEATGCGNCGKPLASFNQTVVGFSPPVAESRLRGTIIGVAPPDMSAPTPPAPAAPAAPAAGLRKTMIGIAPLASPRQAPEQVAPPATSSIPATPVEGGGYPTPPPPPETSSRPGLGSTVPLL